MITYITGEKTYDILIIIRYLFCITERTVYVDADMRLMDKISDVNYEETKVDWTRPVSDSD